MCSQQVCSTLSWRFWPVQSNKGEKKDIHAGKVKLYLFTDDMILYAEDLKESVLKILLEPISSLTTLQSTNQYTKINCVSTYLQQTIGKSIRKLNN